MHAPALQPIPPDMLLLAYRSGIFPMADSRDDPEVFWVEPRVRAILPLEGFHLSRSLAKVLRRDKFRVTCNAAFDRVIAACAAPRADHPESWISARIEESYRQLHAMRHAHSIECWRRDEDGGQDLVGGLYGVGFDRVFCGESMFSRATDASKVALAWLVAALRRGGGGLLDCQFMTGHLASMGAVEISQQRYLRLLAAAQAGSPAGVAAGVGVAAGSLASSPGAALALPDAFDLLLLDAGKSGAPGNSIVQSLTHTS
ncbi:MAG TPA: leucyl/phenylalanyl-tRNA--protein transferase [Croceibacterium sp.]|nr:leucyl/phenylalanyl-tRNA--protein transferase [Croceibacterium sp.]